jgi:transposase-like protein
VIQEAYIQGISTRSVDELVKAMGMGGISKIQVSRLCRVLSATWQRCCVHFMRNALVHAGKTQRRVVSAFVGTLAEWRAVMA